MSLLSLFGLIWLSVVSSLHVDPSKLLVATVLDLADPDMLRDSMTLFRSIRLHGGLLNHATIVSYIVAEKHTAFENDSIIDDLVQLNVSVDFIVGVKPELSRTMNKFAAFGKFDVDYDYLLWLDSDIVIFDDPIPHILPVDMQCVPAMYNYLIRFPHVNSTNLVHNPSLPNFTLIGENATVPHGVCNTGVMLFSRYVVERIIDALPSIAADIDALNPFKKDRFLDSLYFVVAINRLSIKITPWNFTMNYQSFFEDEILSLSNTTELVIAHFITHTMYRCYLNEEKVCICYYANDYIPPNSLIKRETELKMLPRDACLVMAGLAIPEQLNIAPDEPLLPLSHADMPYCGIDYPTSSTILVAPDADVHVPIAVRCALHRDKFATVSPLDVILYDSDSQAVYWSSPIEFACTISSLCSLLDPNSNVFVMRVILGAEVKLPNQVTTNISLSFADLSADPAVVQVEYALTFRVLRSDYESTISSQSDISHPLITALDSQLNFFRFLNARSTHGSALITCCDTMKGLSATKSLILKWRGDIVVIVLGSSPPTISLDYILSDIRDACSSSQHLTCVISQSNSWFRRVSTSYTAMRDAIYIDYYPVIRNSERIIIDKFYNVIRPGGVLLGSRYVDDTYSMLTSRYKEYFIKYEVDALVALRRITRFYVTYCEHCFCGTCSDELECAPAWYLIKA